LQTSRNQIEIVAYNPDWPAAFEAEARLLRATLGSLALRIDHNGSTSVPGLSAKPIIDIQISVASLQPLQWFEEQLGTLGYVHQPHPDDSFCPFFYRPKEGLHSHHVHLVEAGGAEELRTLAFRDYLREHGNVAREYEDLKRDLARRIGEAEAYAGAKTDFIERIIRTALGSGYPRGFLTYSSC